MCRFFAHLCLYFQMIDVTVPPLATQIILESYLQVLEVCSLIQSRQLRATMSSRMLTHFSSYRMPVNET